MTTGEDQRLKCVECGEEFLFTAGEQAFYREHNLTHAPTRCKRCRTNRKGGRAESPGGAVPLTASGGRSKEMHRAVCSECGTETLVPFLPTSGRPIYCRNCYQSRRPDRDAAGAPGARPRPARTERPERMATRPCTKAIWS